MTKEKWWKNLDDEERGFLLKFALIPSSISLDTLIGITGYSAVNILKLLENLVGKKVLSKDEALGEGFYCFHDSSLSQFIIEKTSESKTKSSAEKIILYFEARSKEELNDPYILANLYRLSGLRPERLDFILSTADRCLSQRMKDEAAVFYRMVLDNLPGTKRSMQHKKIYLAAVLGIVNTQGHLIPLKEQATYLNSARRIAKAIKDHQNLVMINLFYARICEQEGYFKRATNFFEEAWKIAKELNKDDLLKKAALMTTDFLFRRGLIAEAIQRYEEVIGNLEEFSADEATLRACAVLGWCYGINGKTARGIGLIEAVLNKAEENRLVEIKIFAKMILVLTLLEARRITEADVYLRQILTLPEDISGYYVLWAAYTAKAYITFINGDLKGCFHFQNKACEFSKKYGWPHHRGPWNFEYIEKLEEAGMVHPWMNYDSEIQRMLNWPDVFMKGVAYRMKAQKALKHSRPMEEVLFDLNKSRKFLSKAGAMLELARTHILLSRLWLDQGKVRNARPLLQKAWEIMSPVNRGLFPDDLRKYLKEENREDILVQTFVEMGNVLGTVREKKKLLENSINLAMQFTSAERGGIFLSSGNGRLKLAASRNFDTAMVQADGFQPYLKEMERVVYSRKGIIRGYAKKSGAGFESLADTNKSGWITLIPIALQEKISGVLYLTGRLTRLLSSKMAIPVLKAIGNQIAIALDNVRAYEEIAALKDRLKEEAHFYRMDSQHSPLLSHIVGRSEAILQVQKKMGKVAVTDSTVLITGETGVGKELVAQGIHRMSHRASGAFIALSITSLAEGVMESELFGHEQGAFTGASKRRLGRFELAHGGTLFLDEIQNLSEEMQAKLLRALEEKTFERVGGSKPIKSDFRLITATNRSLEEMVKGEKFRSDLYYRLSVFPIEVPPLRKRSEDIPPLALHFLELFGKKFDKTIQGISKNHMRKLIEYPWPGNVRELKHVIERSVILSESRFLSLPDLKVVAHDERRPHKFKGGFKEMERTYILQGLEECGWKIKGKNGAAELLKLKPTTLYSKMKKLGLHRNITYAKS